MQGVFPHSRLTDRKKHLSSKIMITGGAGFIGSQLGYELSRQGRHVVLLDNMSTGNLDNLVVEGQTFGEFVAADVREANLVRHFDDVDTVFHFAGIAALPSCQANPYDAYDVNTSGTASVLEAARRAGIRKFVFSSTSAVYENTDTACHAEHDLLSPNLVYAMTKYAAEQVCRAYAVNYGMDVIICRFFNVYGPHQDFKRKTPPFTSYLARELVAGRQPILYNRSDAKRDYVHSTDVVRLLIKILKSQTRFDAETFNVASGEAYSVPEICSLMCEISGKSIDPIYRSPEMFWDDYEVLFQGAYPLSRDRIRKEVYKEACGDNTKTRKYLDWEPTIGIRQGMESVYHYALEHSAA